MVRPQSLEEERTWEGGAEPIREPHSQDNARGGRALGLGLTTIVGGGLIAVPVIWGGYYLLQAANSGVGNGFVVLIALVILACLAAGVLLLRGLLKA